MASIRKHGDAWQARIRRKGSQGRPQAQTALRSSVNYLEAAFFQIVARDIGR